MPSDKATKAESIKQGVSRMKEAKSSEETFVSMRRIQDEQDVSVRQSSLLELDDVTMRNMLSHDPVLVKVIKQTTQVALEHTRRKIRSIFWPLSGQEILCDFLEATTQSQIVNEG